jgi:carboxylesterase type B
VFFFIGSFTGPFSHIVSRQSFLNGFNSFVYFFTGSFPFETPWKRSCALRPCHVTELAFVFGNGFDEKHYASALNTSLSFDKSRNETRQQELRNAGQAPNNPELGTSMPWANDLDISHMYWMTETIMKYWSNFIKTGNPNSPNSTDLPTWPAFSSKNASDASMTVMKLTWPNHQLFNFSELNNRCSIWDEAGYFF